MTTLAELIDADDTPSFRPAFLTALVTIVCLTAAALGWGMFARLDSAVVSHGVLLAESERKTVEHLEGGILERLLVKPGDRVRQGEIVATLDATQIREQLAQFEADRIALTFDIWRLEAEQSGAPRLDPATAPEMPGADERIAAQQRRFDARQRAHIGQVASLRRQIDQLTAQISANEAQASAAQRQIALWTEERVSTSALVAKGASPKQRLLELDRTIATLEGDRDEARGLAEAEREDIARANADIETLDQQRLADLGEQISESRRMVEGLASRVRAAEDVLERHNLRAPQDGVVVDIRLKTPGAVLASGAPLMDIIPDGDRLVVQTRVSPDTIDTVHVGRPAKIRLTAFPRAQAPVALGEVTYVSADMLQDERDGTAYFDARVAIDPVSLEELPGVHITAGMPVEVAIQTGERRAGEYILSPLLRRMSHALHEE
ncbi:MAG: HlyD family type I secretion periplasmic adaptor subunit [Amaricoccus sp.]|uniref:HlyD family type I secretion periplasmic adaptor subunit n=1 Tax=Amaricoccus sp. TaxID=1872485 RepID=UPI003315292E